MSYFDPGSTLPAPFNLIISPKSIFYVMRNVKNCMQYICFRRGRTRPDKRNFGMEKGALQVSPSTCRSTLNFLFMVTSTLLFLLLLFPASPSILSISYVCPFVCIFYLCMFVCLFVCLCFSPSIFFFFIR